MALVPTNEALNRSTPGFDALVGVLENTTNRILRNKQFAKEVQSRKDFAKFQSDLQLQNRLKVMQASSEQQKDFFDYQNQQELGDDGYLRQRLDIQGDAELSQQEDIIDLNIKRGEDVAQSQVTQQNIITSGTREERQIDTTFETDEAIRQGKAIYGARQQTNTNQVSFQDWVREEKESFGSDLSDELIEDDLYFEYREPEIVENEDGQYVYNPVPVTVNGRTKVLTWSEYENEYVPVNKQRFNLKNQIQDLLQNKTHLIEDQASGGKRGVEELTQLLSDIEQREGNYEEMRDFLDGFGGLNVAYTDADVKDTVKQAEEKIYQLKPLFNPISSPILEEGDRISMPRTMSDNSPEYGDFVNQLNERIEEFKWVNLVDKVKTMDDSDQQSNYLSAFQELSKQFANVKDVPTGFRELVMNWDFDANQPHTSSNKLFLTPDEAKAQLIKQATKNFNSPDVQSLNTKTQGQIQFENRKLRD